ncbi:hypothetical protein FS749_011683 [Ceratobasidium sp. UAMH 11750]|nr:hypothetical protein FS749_011683 [Ceratobasidium sp. UAMH 11750]
MAAFTLLNHTDAPTVDVPQNLGDAPLWCYLNYENLPTGDLDHLTQPIPPKRPPYGSFPPEISEELNRGEDTNFSVFNNTSQPAAEATQSPQDPNPFAPITAATNPFYPIQDNHDTAPLEQPQIFDINDPIWEYLNLLIDPTCTRGRDSLPTETLPIPPLNNLDLYETFKMFDPTILQPQDIAPFGLSPNTSESCTSEWTPESTSRPLFSPPGPGILTNNFTALDVPSPAPAPPPPPISPPPSPLPRAIKTKVDVDAYVERLVARRRHRGKAPELKCAFEECDPNRTHRRPSELKEHMYAHIGVFPYECLRAGCTSTFGTKSNLTRHRKTCRPTAK